MSEVQDNGPNGTNMVDKSDSKQRQYQNKDEQYKESVERIASLLMDSALATIDFRKKRIRLLDVVDIEESEDLPSRREVKRVLSDMLIAQEVAEVVLLKSAKEYLVQGKREDRERMCTAIQQMEYYSGKTVRKAEQYLDTFCDTSSVATITATFNRQHKLQHDDSLEINMFEQEAERIRIEIQRKEREFEVTKQHMQQELD